MRTAIILFALTYILLLAMPNRRAIVALCSAALFILLGILPVEKVLDNIDFNVLMMIAGTMGIVSLFIDSRMPALMADLILRKMPNVKWAIVSLALFAGVISAFVDNVATVLMVAPVALAVSQKLGINPVGMIIAIAVSSTSRARPRLWETPPPYSWADTRGWISSTSSSFTASPASSGALSSARSSPASCCSGSSARRRPRYPPMSSPR